MKDDAAHQKRVRNRAQKYRIARAEAERQIAELDAKRAGRTVNNRLTAALEKRGLLADKTALALGGMDKRRTKARRIAVMAKWEEIEELRGEP